MGFKLAVTVWLGCCVLPAAAENADAPSAPDLILTGGRVLTVDANDRVAEALAIKDGRILAVGSTAEIARLAGPATERIDLAGRTATPGLIDAHAHFSQGGLVRLTYLGLAFPDVKSIADVVARVGERANVLQAGEWILGRGWDEGKYAERRLVTAADLDAASRGHPAWLVHTTGHYGVANSVALGLAGITRGTPDPPGGLIDRDAQGNPTGVLKETAMALVANRVPKAGPETLREAIRAMSGEFNRECMTGVKDPGIGSSLFHDADSALEYWNAYRDVLADGGLSVRVFALWHSPRNIEDASKLVELITPLGKPAEGGGDDRLVSGGVKIFADGSGAARTAWMWQDWNRDRTGIDAGNRGYPAFDPELIRALILLYHDAGLHVGTHAIGDRAIDWVVDSYALALRQKPVRGMRHSIIHANIPGERALEAMAVMQRDFDAGYPEPSPSFTWWIGDIYAGTFGPERSLRLNPFASFLDQGIRWASGSDFDVTPFAARYGIWSSIAREPLLGVHGGDPFGRAEAVDVHAALRSFTIWAAHQTFMDDVTGSLEPGKRADVAVWDTDFYAAPSSAIKDSACLMTIFDGDVVYRDERFPVTGEPQIHPGDTDEFAFHAADNPLPEAADVVVIGGGIIGSTTAYFLARAGVSVALFEKGRIAGEQSGRNWGWVRQQCRSPVELPLMIESLAIWKELSAHLGDDLGFRQGGTLYLAGSEGELAGLAQWLGVARTHGLDTKVIAGRELADVFPGGSRFVGALYTASDGRAEPSRAGRAIARGAARAGAHVVSRCAVRGIETAAGRVSAVITEHGRVATRAVVCAAGAWTRLFCGSLGIRVPQLPVLNSVARLAPAPKLLDGQAWSPALAIRRRADGGYTVAHGHSSLHSLVPASFREALKFLPALRASPDSVRLSFGRDFFASLATPSRWALDAVSPFEQERVLNPAPAARELREMRASLDVWLPEIAGAAFVETWGGMIEASPDVLPIIAPIDSIGDFYVATGFSGHGFGIGPGAGRLIAGMVNGTAASSALAGFRLSRFFDGSPIVPGPAI